MNVAPDICGRHKSILGYVVAQGPSTTVTTLRAELRLGEEAFPAATAHKYGKLLEKKWTTVSRLERKASCRLLVLLRPPPLQHYSHVLTAG